MDLRERAGVGDAEAAEGRDGGRRHPWELARARFFRGLVGRSTDVGGVRRVLDVGAGDGWFAQELLPDLGPAAEVVCWDVNYRSEDLATPEGERITRTAARPAPPFELVLLLDVLEHVEDDDGFLGREVVPLLAPAGLAVVSVPAHPWLFSDHDRMLQHHRRYRPQGLRALVGRHLDLVASGSVFTSLLAPRAASVVAERAGRHHEATGIGAWRGGPTTTRALTAVLEADAAASAGLSRRGIPVPGLSTWAVARARGSVPS
jgi:SAM-dependent methyltransferase